MEALQVAFAELARTVERYIAQHSFSLCGGPFNGGNYPGCSSVGSENEFVYDPNPYSYNETPKFFNQPPHHQYKTYSCEFLPQQFNCCEYCGGLHDSSNFQLRNPVFYESNSYNNFDSSCFDQSPQYPIVHPPLYEMSLHELSMMMNLGTPTPEPLVNYFVYEESDDDIEVNPEYTPSLPFLTTIEPADTLLMGDEVISTTPVELTSDSNLQCDMPVNTPLPSIDVREENLISIRL
ncbi:hypothetical protein Tco_1234685 [Tanacetum coccineum]